MEKLVIAGREFGSRLFLGTGKFSSYELMQQAIKASRTEMVTVAMKRIELGDSSDDMLQHIVNNNITLLPNTSGVRNAEEAVFAAQMSREAFGTPWLKLEIHPDPRYLLPDSVETLKATEDFVSDHISHDFCYARQDYSLEMLLATFIRANNNFAFVINHEGKIVGYVMLANLMEQLFGANNETFADDANLEAVAGRTRK